MASSSSSSSSSPPPYDVFPSFSGEDVRRTFLSHVHDLFGRKTIKTFKDEKIQKGETIGPELIQAIKASRISIVVLSKNYASSSWCLDELLEIMNCKEAAKQKVITIFYGVDPSDVRKRTGDFGKAFEKTCVGKTEEKKQSWSKALTDVANIAGYHSQNWSNEANMIKEIAADVLNKLNRLAIPKDFDGLVGIEDHLTKIESLLCPKSNEVRMIGILGPRGIGKTTIARALYHHLYHDFELNCFVENIRGRFSRTHHDAYSYKLYLQHEFLSLILDDKSLRVNHSRVVEERLSNHRVFVVLDDVDGIEQLQALADKDQWFGPKSRIVVITENKDLLIRHGINHIYEVNLPSWDEALQIFCQYAFRQNSPPNGFYELAEEVSKLACALPLGLSVLGSSLYGRSEDEWRKRLPRLKGRLDGKIEKELRVGYDCLDEKDQAIFRHIACLFPTGSIDYVKSLLEDSDLDIDLGLEMLARNSLIQISSYGTIEMHDLLVQAGREIVREQNTKEPRKREFLVDEKDIEDVLTHNIGGETILGISFDTRNWDFELFINERAFKSMTNLQFLSIYQSFNEGNKVHLPKGLSNLPHKLRLLHWDYYPLKSLPPNFCPKNLVELRMPHSKLEKLWEEIKPLRRLKWLDLNWPRNLKEIPDLSKAKNLETLDLMLDTTQLDLVALPSIGHLSKLMTLNLFNWKSLEVLPTNINLKSLNAFNCGLCSQLRCFPEISQNLERLDLSMTAIEEVPASVALWPRLIELDMSYCENLKTFPHVPNCIKRLTLLGSGIAEVPSRIKNLFQLHDLNMSSCKKLTNISSNIFKLEKLEVLTFSQCENLKTFYPPLESPEIPHEMVSTTLDLVFDEVPSIRDPFLSYGKRHTLVLNCCKKLVELPKLPMRVSKLKADGCESLERILHPFNNDPEMELRFSNCFKLNGEARQLIQETVCRYTILPGTELPPYITHRASGSSLTISSDKMPISGFLDSKPYLLLAAILNYGWKSDCKTIKCHVKGQHGSVAFQSKWITYVYSYGDYSDRDVQSEHLIIFRIFDWLKEDDVPRDELSDEPRVLEFTCDSLDDIEIREFGVHLLDSPYFNAKEKSNIDTDGAYRSAADNLPSDIDPYHQWLLLF